MTAPLPDPLVPPEVDLRGYEFMPYYGDRLRDSDLNSRASDAEYRAAHNLWWSAWKQLPAASLPDDDATLARLADMGRDVKAWRKVREVALRGFVKCSDDRLYHRVLAPLAIEAWEYRNRQRTRTEAARLAKLSTAAAPKLSTDTRNLSQTLSQRKKPSVTEPEAPCNNAQRSLSQTEKPPVTDSTGQDRTGQDRGTTAKPPPPSTHPDPVFGPYLAMLEAKGISSGHARSFVALMRQGYGDDLVLTVLAEAQRLDVTKPLPWVKKALETRSRPRENKQEALETRNRSASQDWTPPEERDAAA